MFLINKMYRERGRKKTVELRSIKKAEYMGQFLRIEFNLDN